MRYVMVCPVAITVSLFLIISLPAQAATYTLPPRHPGGNPVTSDCGDIQLLEVYKLARERQIKDARTELEQARRHRDFTQKQYDEEVKRWEHDTSDSAKASMEKVAEGLAGSIQAVKEAEDHLQWLLDDLDKFLRAFNDNCHPTGGGCETVNCRWQCPFEPPPPPPCRPFIDPGCGGGQCR